MRYSAAQAMLAHRYGSISRPVMPTRYGAHEEDGLQELRPVPAAGIDTGTVHLQPLTPDLDLSQGAEDGIEAGFREFFEEYQSKG